MAFQFGNRWYRTWGIESVCPAAKDNPWRGPRKISLPKFWFSNVRDVVSERLPILMPRLESNEGIIAFYDCELEF